MVKIPLAWEKLTLPKYAGYNATLEPIQTFRVVDADDRLIKQVQRIELDLLEKLQQVCKKHNLTVFAIYGSLLGAVRHGGLIPGDDDIDVALLRPDYDRLMSLRHEFTGKYFLQTPEADNYFCGGYSKLRNTETTAVSPNNWFVDCCEGISIDIFPIDKCSKSPRKEKKRQKMIRFYQRMLYAYTYGYFLKYMDMPILIWKGYKYLGKLFPRQMIIKKFNDVLKNGDSESNKYCCYTHYTPKSFKKGLDKNLFSSFESVPFENKEILIPNGFDKILENRYGRYLDYSVYPELRKYRHAFYATNNPYTFYKPKFRYCCRPVPKDKKLVLIGDNVMLSEFYGRWGVKFLPEFFVEIEKIDWEIPKPMISLKRITFDEFARNEKKDYYIVICSIHFREVEKKLRDIGSSDYYIFVWKKDWIMLSNPDVVVIEEKIKNGSIEK